MYSYGVLVWELYHTTVPYSDYAMDQASTRMCVCVQSEPPFSLQQAERLGRPAGRRPAGSPPFRPGIRDWGGAQSATVGMQQRWGCNRDLQQSCRMAGVRQQPVHEAQAQAADEMRRSWASKRPNLRIQTSSRR